MRFVGANYGTANFHVKCVKDKMEKLDIQHKHILKLINRDKKADGWTPVSKQLFPVLSKNMPKELVEFEKSEDGGMRARLTEEGCNVVNAMAWL